MIKTEDRMNKQKSSSVLYTEYGTGKFKSLYNGPPVKTTHEKIIVNMLSAK